MKKTLLLTLILILVFSNVSFAVLTPGDITGEAAILIDMESGQVLFDKNAYQLMYPASTTKILTAIIILEDCDLTDEVVIDGISPYVDGSKIYMDEGEILTVEQLVNALLVKSANDAAAALAIYHSGSIEAFADVMDERAKEMGALNSNFENPNGLPDPDHMTTAYDLAMIARYAMQNPQFAEIVKKPSYTIPPTNMQPETRVYNNSNRFLYATGGSNRIDYKGKTIDIKYDLVTGIKTGYTDTARQCIVTSIEDGDKKFIAVVLKAEGKNIYVDARTLMDYGIEEFTKEHLAKAGDVITTIDIDDYKDSTLNLVVRDDISGYIHSTYSSDAIQQSLVVYDDIQLPIEEGQALGTITYYVDNNVIGISDLVAESSVSGKPMFNAETKSLISNEKEQRSSTDYIFIGLKVLLIFVIWRTIMTMIKLKKKKRR